MFINQIRNPSKQSTAALAQFQEKSQAIEASKNRLRSQLLKIQQGIKNAESRCNKLTERVSVHKVGVVPKSSRNLLKQQLQQLEAEQKKIIKGIVKQHWRRDLEQKLELLLGKYKDGCIDKPEEEYIENMVGLLQQLRQINQSSQQEGGDLNPQKMDRLKQYEEQVNSVVSRYQTSVKGAQRRRSFRVLKRDTLSIIKQKAQKQRRLQYAKQKYKPPPVANRDTLEDRIKVDKLQSPLKYKILSKKGLNDEQIYSMKEYDAELIKQRKKLGGLYLQQSKQRVKTDLDIQSIVPSSPAKFKYPDYLPDIRKSRLISQTEAVNKKRSSSFSKDSFELQNPINARLHSDLSPKIHIISRRKMDRVDKESDLLRLNIKQQKLDAKLVQSIKAKLDRLLE